MALHKSRLSRFTAALAVGGCLFLSACTTAPAPPEEAESAATTPTVDEPVVYRNFGANSLYELMLAEFAGIRDQVEPALEIYTIQAHETRDPAVIARAIHIASFLKRSDVILDLAELWAVVEPDNIEVRRLLAFHLASAGRVVEAFPHGLFLLKTGDQDYLQSLAAFATESPIEEKQRLLSLYEDLEVEYPDEPGLLLGKAMLLNQLDQRQDSLAVTDKLIAIDPDNETGQLLHAQLLHAIGEPKKAQKSLQKALKRMPSNKRLRLQYARFLSEGDMAKSRQQIAILAEQYPEDSNILFSLGLAHNEIGDLTKARQTFKTLIEQGKRTSDAHYMLGRIAESDNQPEEAVFEYRQVRDGQNLLPASMRVAELYTEHDNLAAGREYLSSLRAIYPALRENLFQMEAELLIKMDRLNEAYDLLSTAISEDESSVNLRYARSVVSAEQQDMAAVEEDLRAILELDENNATALNALGYTMLNLTDRYQEAQSLIVKAYELEPDNPAILDSLGWAYFRLGDTDKALSHLQQAFESFPEAEVAAHLGEVLWQLGRIDEATAVWQKGFEANPEDKTLLDTLNRLAPTEVKRLRGGADAASN